MSNNETGFIKFLMLLLVLGLTSGLIACQPNSSQVYGEPEKESIIGGKAVTSSSIFSQRVIYLALGVSWTQTTSRKKEVHQDGLCSATAIAPKILLTAAHCVVGLKPSQVNAVLSLNPWNHKPKEKEWVQVDKIVIHEKYADHTSEQGIIENDLALVRLTQNLPPERISQISYLDETPDSMSLVSIGYGKKSPLINPIEEEHSSTDVSWLFYVIKSVEDYIVTKPLFSTAQNDLTGFCSGDSGGPGFIYDDVAKDFLIVGVASFLSITQQERAQYDPNDIYDKCIGHGNYTNITYHKNWIQTTISGL